MSSKISEYGAHAEQAERLARASTSAEERSAYERIASVWRELAATETGPSVSAEASAEG